MTVQIPPEHQQFVQDAIDSGGYHSEAEVVGEALRLLRERKLFELREDIDAGAAQLDRGEGIELRDEESLRAFFEDIKERGRKRLAVNQNRQ